VSGKDRKLPGICPEAATIVAPKSVGSRTTNGQMKATSKGEFNGFPGRRDGQNRADRLDRASRVFKLASPARNHYTVVKPHHDDVRTDRIIEKWD
jgi:hypothetical protein